MPYSLLRPLLFRLDPEIAHRLVLALLGAARVLMPAAPTNPLRVMGLDFVNPIGLAAGLDKNADHLDALGALGFGFIEVGTVTPRPQAGNPRPRLFRLPEAEALINRMGFNNRGVDHVVERLRRRRYPGVVGVNIGKNRDTPAPDAAQDYLHCLHKVYPLADYVTVNVSSPNTSGLRDLQHGRELDTLLAALKSAQLELSRRHRRYVPLALKIAPDLSPGEIDDIGAALRRHRFDAAVATNTTLSRAGVEGLPAGGHDGGLSGRPLAAAASSALAALHAATAGQVPLIAAGGVSDGDQVRRRFAAGASLVQLYTGLIYRGPGLVREAVAASRETGATPTRTEK